MVTIFCSYFWLYYFRVDSPNEKIQFFFSGSMEILTNKLSINVSVLKQSNIRKGTSVFHDNRRPLRKLC